MKFFETIRIEDGRIHHLPYHQRRVDATLAAHYPHASIDLAGRITPPPDGLWRCRVVYDDEIDSVSYHPYTPRKVSSIRLIEADIDYPYKYCDRSAIDELFAQRGDADEILIVKEGLLTDTSIANIALYIEGTWLTPAKPLLAGTTRARLIDEGALKTADLTPDDLKRAQKVALLNAMVGFLEVKLSIIS